MAKPGNAVLLQALRQYQAGDRAAAEATARRLLAEQPAEPTAILLLALIRADGPDIDGAEKLFSEYLARLPDDPLALHNLGKLKQRRGDDESAVRFFARATERKSDFAPSFNDLGASLRRLGHRERALAAFDRAVAIDPAYATAHCNRALLLIDFNRRAEAAEAFRHVLTLDPGKSPSAWHSRGLACGNLDDFAGAEAAYRQALALDPNYLEAWLQLADTLERAHRPADAERVRAQWARRQGVVVKPCLGGNPQARILLVGAAGLCNVPTYYLIDSRLFDLVIVHLLPPGEEGAAEAARTDRLPPFDIAFNVVGDADRGTPFIDQAAALCRGLACPVLNPPERIAPTRRDRLPQLLADIPGLVVPRMQRLDHAALVALAAAGDAFAQPMLVRPAGSHGGVDLARIDDRAALDDYLERVPVAEYYVSDFWDYCSADGHFRKYRLVFVDRAVFPYHLAIARDWLVHYWRADMQPWMKDEEAAFLAGYESVFTGDAGAAVRAVAQRLDLDYAGIDCTILRDGRVLLFEANATMLVNIADAGEDFPYKLAYVPRIREAMTRLVLARIDAARAA